ncbi:MAG: hypothetical protein VX899_12995 [Myxococcota bacterium]|nr:hypothetical protein [Myxococcota bacterium]
MRMNPSGLGLQVTQLLKLTVPALFVLYVLQLLMGSWLGWPVEQWLFMSPISGGHWRPWQPLTALLFNSSPISALLDWLVLGWFLGPAEQALGRKRLLGAMATAALGAGALTTGLDAIGLLAGGGVFVGLEPILTGLVVIFGMAHPNATIRLFFVLPIKAQWLAWGSGVLALLFFLAQRDLSSAMYLFGWVSTFAFMSLREDFFRQMWLRWKARKHEKELGKFTVIKGGKDENGDDWVN